jgi:glutamate dehydrogenase (NAD(P)+)
VTELEELSAEEGRLEWDTPLFRTALTQFEQAVPYADVNESIAERLRYPERAVMVTVPIRSDA